MNGRLYGNSSMGFGYSPNRSRDVSHDNPRSQFLRASGNRQGGYWYSANSQYNGTTYGTKHGRYLGNGQYVEE